MERIIWKPVGDRMLRGEFGSLVIKIEPWESRWNGDVMGAARYPLADLCHQIIYLRDARSVNEVKEWAERLAGIWADWAHREAATTQTPTA